MAALPAPVDKGIGSNGWRLRSSTRLQPDGRQGRGFGRTVQRPWWPTPDKKLPL